MRRIISSIRKLSEININTEEMLSVLQPASDNIMERKKLQIPLHKVNHVL